MGEQTLWSYVSQSPRVTARLLEGFCGWCPLTREGRMPALQEMATRRSADHICCQDLMPSLKPKSTTAAGLVRRR